jgi:hypothetical protein
MRENDLRRGMNGWNIVAGEVERLGCSVCLGIRRFAQDDGKNKDGKAEADSSARLRNDDKKAKHGKSKGKCGVLPFDKLRVSMTIVRRDLF